MMSMLKMMMMMMMMMMVMMMMPMMIMMSLLMMTAVARHTGRIKLLSKAFQKFSKRFYLNYTMFCGIRIYFKSFKQNKVVNIKNI